ncbi:hypothetical protein CH333_10545 [candidate division WOR-3 bacterium JGI_Cruoil_03_44_89]|uniref:Uncharacterized protein n=1 Tax=candidate division WOR-3 bacterium JGI_Cruoil_03_44_89 TaxID=1973748 RepID=A0A235BNN2_UNCW3|nr:MAG: hypothetical protein CH333_10545 [candidate division WOR-3 bacterium JGI_Cruoil_03_44_89]
MKTKLFLYAFGVWFIFVIAAILNGGFRESFVTPKVGEYAGHVISTIIFICVILAGTYLFISNLKIDYNKTDLVLIGAFWLILTILFEFGFGHYVIGHSWSRLFADYNILKGRVWSLVLLTTFIAPLVVGTILKK